MEAKLSTFSAFQEGDNSQQQSQAADTSNTQQNADTSNSATSQDNGSQAAGDQSQQAADATNQNQENQAQGDSIDFKVDFDNDEESQNQQSNQSQQAQPRYNWKDEIKKLNKTEILKELGVNEFAIEMNEHITRGGKPDDYLAAKAIDYNAISDETLLKNGLKKQYNTKDDKLIDILYNRKYGVADDASDDDKVIAELQVKSEANAIRQQAISEQQKYKLPDAITPQNDEAYSEWKQFVETADARRQERTDFYVNHQATKTLHESKRVAISLGDGVKPFNFNIEKPEVITRAMTDGGATWQKLTSTQSGEPDVQKQQLIALFTINPNQFCQAIFNYGKSMGVHKELVEGGQNAQRPQAKVVNVDANAKPTYKAGTYAGGSQ